MITRRAKPVRLDHEMIDAIWASYNVIKPRVKSKDAACKRIASFIGCSASSVYRVIVACEDAAAGTVLKYDPIKYPNFMMVEYINQKFAQPQECEVEDDLDIDDTELPIEMRLTSILQELVNIIKSLKVKS